LLFQLQIKALSALACIRLLNVHICTLPAPNPRRLDFILDLKSTLRFISIKNVIYPLGNKNLYFALAIFTPCATMPKK
jgi:hypothetical protein